MPDETRGVPLHYAEPNFYGCRHGSVPTHRAYPVDEAAAMEDVIAAARDPLRTDGLLHFAIARLDALRLGISAGTGEASE